MSERFSGSPDESSVASALKTEAALVEAERSAERKWERALQRLAEAERDAEKAQQRLSRRREQAERAAERLLQAQAARASGPA